MKQTSRACTHRIQHGEESAAYRSTGTDERIAVYFGIKLVSGKLRVASINNTLDGFLQANTEFSISATLKQGETSRKVTFDSCFLEDKAFATVSDGHETVYSFTATRVRDE